MASAASQVLDTYELLERILFGLPMKKLFVVQRVSHKWRAVIQRSQDLRRKMFLIPEGAPQRPEVVEEEERCWEEPKYSNFMRPNPLLNIMCGSICHGQSYRHPPRDRDRSLDCYLTLSPHPKNHTDESLCFIVNGSDRGTTTHDDLSLRRAFVTQPPAVVLGICNLEEMSECSVSGYGPCVLYNPEGITIGNVHDFYTEVNGVCSDRGPRFPFILRMRSLRAGGNEIQSHWESKDDEGIEREQDNEDDHDVEQGDMEEDDHGFDTSECTCSIIVDLEVEATK